MEAYSSVAKTDEAKLKAVLTAVQTAPSCSTQGEMGDRVPGDSTLIRIPRVITLLMMHGGILASGPSEKQVEEDSQTSQDALKCLSNCLLQHEECLAEFEKNEGVVLLLQMLKKVFGWCGSEIDLEAEMPIKAHSAMYSTDDLFLYARLLFICTATNSETVHNVVDKYDGVDILNQVWFSQ
ncbi:MAG: hypothetical protein BJ554DRAFT_7829 [Olpidium bornovanus]|uniref:Uncharacterized protein n=1 Tax=Olpidium bornovanus TaxID=278681 RepID=A0A8H7ZWB0_9FUNG|nr:MAG: hypothetical protein BJ554DRAFT_7829 [Olpidium bornovanus]